MKKQKKSKKSDLEDLIQKYINATGVAKKMLLGLIRLKDPNFKEIK
jgi:hypothetical protein